MNSNIFSENSKWIWMEGAEKENCYLQFMTEIKTESTLPLTLLLTAEVQYTVFFDGEYLPSTQYPDFPYRKSVQKIEISDIKADTHTLEIQVWYLGKGTFSSLLETPGLRFELWQGDNLLTKSVEGMKVRPLAGYQSGPVPDITGQIGPGFNYTIKEEEPWQTASLVEKSCTFALRPIPELTVHEMQPAKLISQGVFTSHESDWQQYASLAFRERDDLTEDDKDDLVSGNPVRFVSDEADGIYMVFDLSEESVGYLDIDVVCPTATRIDIGFGEHLDDLRVRTDVRRRHFTVGFEAGPERQRFIHRFLRLGCRYLQLHFYGHDVTVYHVGLQKVDYPVRGIGTFKSCDNLMDKIFEVSKTTLRCSMHEHYEDCPWREQGLYAMDSRNQMLSGYYAFGEFTQPRESLRTLALTLSIREDGLLEMCAPAKLDGNIPCFSLMFITALEEYCRFSGDLEFTEEMISVCASILKTFHKNFSDGLMYGLEGYWNFYEWTPMLKGPSSLPAGLAASPLQLFYLLALQRMEKICGYLNLEASGLKEEIDAVTKGMEKFWDEEAGAYAAFIKDGEKIHFAQLTQSLVLYTGICPKERQEELCRKLLADELVPVSLATSIFKYEALLMQSREYAEEVFRQVAERWGNMIYQGATTFWETDLGAVDFYRAGSLCHGWSAIPAYLIGAYILSVRPEEPGVWKQHDEEACMYYAEGTLLSPQGEMTVIRKK